MPSLAASRASFALLKYHFLNAKAVVVGGLSALLALVTFIEIIFSPNLEITIYRVSEFLLVLIFGFLLVRSVTKEVKLREEIQLLANNLKIANEKLKELDRLKSEFLSIASHDLRTPLTIVRNFMSLLLDGTYGKLAPAAEEGARQVFDRATDMAKSVDSYLNVSRINRGG